MTTKGHMHQFRRAGRDWKCIHCDDFLRFAETDTVSAPLDHPMASARALLSAYMKEEGATAGQVAARLGSLIDAPMQELAANAWDEGHSDCSCDRPGNPTRCLNPYSITP